ncbi:hypothetical protein FA95DRAFT_1503145, partial [Auriscalpium vulgare]
VVDNKERVLLKMLGHPRGDPSWPKQGRTLSQDMTKILADFPDLSTDGPHQRGNYPAVTYGYMFGGGPKTPFNIRPPSRTHEKVIKRLERLPSIGRFVGHTNTGFGTGNPRLYTHLEDVLSDVRVHDPSLQPPFGNSVFPAVTFNFGPQALTIPHRDWQNVPYGWCAVTALGDFDPTRGGHLILWELKLVIEFPPGSTILLPSAVITHSNAPIQEGETRQSFTQWCAGALVRWWAYGFRTEEGLGREDPKRKAELDAIRDARWSSCIGLFSTLSDLKEDIRTFGK